MEDVIVQRNRVIGALPLLLVAFAAAPVVAQGPQQGPGLPAARGVATTELGSPVGLAEAAAGSLLLRTTHPGVYLPAAVLRTEVEIVVSGIVAHARVRQRFRNPTALWVEGVYVFPLPERAAVHGLEMRVGARHIVGQIQERRAAEAAYERARREGRKASLVSQERPNLFTTAVANLGPGEEVAVTLEYDEEVSYEGGAFSLRFPMTVTPRYRPLSSTHPVPPSVPFRHGRDGEGTSIVVDLDAGFGIGSLTSPSHALAAAVDGRFARVELGVGAVPADRDFVLRWTPRPHRGVEPAVFVEELDGERHALVMVMPSRVEDDAAHPPRELILVIDTSGSMSGASLRQAKAALVAALEGLRPWDRFNVLRFASTTEQLFDASRVADGDAVDRAVRWVEALTAGGGTEMLPALAAALDDPWPASSELRQVVFVTDGAVTDGDRLHALIAARLGRSRLFPVGIGAAPNGHFMRQAAIDGRGTFTYVSDLGEVSAKMATLLHQLESPVLRDLEVDWGTADVAAWPRRPPDLYAGDPLILAARLSAAPEEIRLRGFVGGGAWEETLPLPATATAPGIARLWARRQIAALRADRESATDTARVREQILAVALHHHLVSDFTSLVAVDRTPTAPTDRPQARQLIPLDLPAGWQPPPSLPAGGTASRLELLAATLLLLAAVGMLRR